MSTETRIVSPGPDDRRVVTQDGKVTDVPADWELLPPGDATLTRRVKASGPTWTVQQKKGRRTFSRGVFAPADTITQIRADLASERQTPAYAKKRKADLARREKKQSQYVDSFYDSVLAFLAFDQRHALFAKRLAEAVTAHATPVGSGTVARTERIPIERRAEAAVIAWMRHQTTAYDDMAIARVKGRRREVRQQLAAESRRLLDRYRRGEPAQPDCPLLLALDAPS